MTSAVVVDAVRTPMGRASAEQGCYRDVRSEDLSVHVIRALLERTRIEPERVEEVRWGCVQQQGEQGYDIARIAALAAGLPVETGGVTVNRNCASSLQAINDVAMSIAAEVGDIQIAGGVEHMEHVPMMKDYNPYPGLFRDHSEAIMNMGLTAEYLAAKYRIPRGARTSSRSAATSSPPPPPTGANSSPRSFRPGDAMRRAARRFFTRTRASGATRHSTSWRRSRRRSARKVAP